jgi:dephospho-CoA kinase
MKVIGITGGIGSGKTIVCDIFRKLGIPVYEADAEAKKLYAIPEVQDEVKKTFGNQYFTGDGNLDRKKFAELVFNNAAALKQINAIIHPFVKKNFREWKKDHAQKPYVLKEAAILFESGTDKGCDKIIVVTAPEQLRIERVMQRDKRSREEVLGIISRQMSDEEKIKKADFVIVNDNKRLVIPEVLKIHQELSNL